MQALDEVGWLGVLQRLRDAGLVAQQSGHSPENLDAHPLVREHFGQQLREQNPDAWREGHSRLYEHLRDTAKPLPDTIEEMAPLFAAVAHGCQAGRHQEAFDEVYYQRIQRDGETNFCVKQLGAIGSDLSSLAAFFDPPWSRPAASLTDAAKGFALSAAGFRLRGLGRLREAGEPMQAGLEAAVGTGNWRNGAIAASNLSQLHVTIGHLHQGLKYGRQGVEMADRSGNASERIINRATLADAMHQAGKSADAEALFREAENMQKAPDPETPFLYSLRGSLYCELLLDQAKFDDVRQRAEETLEWAASEGLLLDVGLDHVSLGRALLLQTQVERTRDFSDAVRHLDQAVDGLRQAGRQDHIPRGLLARAELHRVARDFSAADRDLEEALTIAERGSMGRFQADAHLEYARLYAATGERDRIRESLATAKKMIGDMGYHRRDGEVAELERAVAQASE